MASPLEGRIAARLAQASASINADGVARLARYVELLAHWNRRINLTSLDLDPPTDAAIDRLLVEPVIAAQWVRASDTRAIDVGSGGGSPAIPIAIACPALHVTMVESRGKKCAFLREAIREIGLAHADVLQQRFGDDAGAQRVSLLTVRAVRLDASFWQIANKITSQSARVISLSAAIDAVENWAVTFEGRFELRVLDRSESV